MIETRTALDGALVAATEGNPSAVRRWAIAERFKLTPPRAIRAIALVTSAVTLVSGALIHAVDGKEFPTIGRGLWWAAQTVTTVGYGDAVPRTTGGRLVAIVVMLCALAFLTVVTAGITAALIERGRQRLGVSDGPPVNASLHELGERLARLEELLRERSES